MTYLNKVTHNKNIRYGILTFSFTPLLNYIPQKIKFMTDDVNNLNTELVKLIRWFYCENKNLDKYNILIFRVVNTNPDHIQFVEYMLEKKPFIMLHLNKNDFIFTCNNDFFAVKILHSHFILKKLVTSIDDIKNKERYELKKYIKDNKYNISTIFKTKKMIISRIIKKEVNYILNTYKNIKPN